MSTPSTDERLRMLLAHLPEAGVRALLCALTQAQSRARALRRPVPVTVTFDVGQDGPEEVEVTTRYGRDLTA